MHFHAREIGHGEHFREQRANVVEMRENALGVGITFAAENFVAVNSEPIEEIFFSAAVFSTNRGKPAVTASSFPGCTLK